MTSGLHLRAERRAERRKNQARVAVAIVLSAAVAVTVLLQPGYRWVSLVIGVSIAIAVTASGGLSRARGRGRVATFLGCATIIVSGLVTAGWQWLALAAGVSAAIAVAASRDLTGGRRYRRDRGHSGRDRGLDGRGRDGDGPAGVAAHSWHTLVILSRLMPGPAGRRWLAEADSLLSESTPAQRGAAIRSYQRCAPRLAAAMWVRHVQRRARPGKRRPQ